MGKLMEIITSLHKKTERNYLARMIDDKVECMKVAKEYGKEFWDGDRKYGYGGYHYDGRQKRISDGLIKAYNLEKDAKILDVGCGKGYLIYELQEAVPTKNVSGFDISSYALENCKEEIKSKIFRHEAQTKYPFKDKEFDLAISITTLHNLPISDLKSALQEIERVGKEKYVAVESFRNDKELFNLQCWALTCNSFFGPDEWKWIFNEFGYTGDYEFIYFE
ncbi:MAG: class I SAM-dependent methyltransferase [Candidatus Nanoarchaeia archaeon]|nr:class I SAM-dependent methyltransferase [Candidatus Nanoarchaeia archaeon]MDD5358119.1 class I SAM-dependent methyltransferase [Candidatus Nanoarchaeia archaeon]MDD5589306.1 class I SAM-dependent methyltransferase [Candidatus Nanoarchaeia archaeon]